MVGVPGIASAIFSTVRDAGINVIMISQASSEQSICFAVKSSDGDAAVQVGGVDKRELFGGDDAGARTIINLSERTCFSVP
jgi:predicted amino acid-binding ACT domain protein